MVRAIAPTGTVSHIKRLGGGLGSATHRVTIERRSGRTFDVILKRTREFNGQAEREWDRLCFAESLPVRSAEPLAFDAEGVWFGAPAYVQSCIPGRHEHHFADDGRRYAQVAEAICANATVAVSSMPKHIRRPPFEFVLPDRVRRTALVDRALAVIERELPAVTRPRRVVTHGDFHPGNTLWIDDRLSGLVDWACLNHYLEREVVYFRTELAVLLGSGEADRFLDVFERVAGRKTQHMPVWDLMQGLTAMAWGRWWAYAYREQGRRDLTDELAIRRARKVVERALATI